MFRECRVICLGLCDYKEAYMLQKQLLCRRIGQRVQDTLVLMQHPSVFTIGRRGSRKNIIVNPEVLYREGILIYEADRGGDITYHGPGQLVAYPILDLNRHGRDVARVINMYEEAVIKTLAGFNIEGSRIPEYPGVWVGNEKISAVGIGISNWVTYHGFSININTYLKHFSYIIPCGIKDRGITSMEKILGRKVDEISVEEELVKAFGDTFNLEMKYQVKEQA